MDRQKSRSRKFEEKQARVGLRKSMCERLEDKKKELEEEKNKTERQA